MVYIVLTSDFRGKPFAVFGNRNAAEILLRAMGYSEEEIEARILEVPYFPTRFE